MSPEEKAETLNHLLEERGNYQSILSEMRKDRMEKRLSAQTEFDQYSNRIGELSLAVSAAITPVMIISNNQIDNKGFLIAGIISYLIVGMAALFRVKRSIEDKVDNYSKIGIDLENDIEKITNNINKLIWDIDNTKYQKEYINSKKSFIENHTNTERPVIKTSYALDWLVGGFLVATFLSFRVVWPDSGALYYCLTGMATLILFALLTLNSSKRSQKLQQERQNFEEEYDKTRSLYLQWQDKEVFKK